MSDTGAAAQPEVLFYHLQREPLEKVLPVLLAKTLERGWSAVVEVPSRERIAALDEHLWTFSDDSFLPHATNAEPDIAQEPIVLTDRPGNPNGAQVRFLVDGAGLPDDANAYHRLVLMFDGADPEALARARNDWRTAKAKGWNGTYWQQGETGRWEKKA